MIKYDEMKQILLKLNAKWKLDFVSATAGDCCNTCTDMHTEEETEQYYNAKTFLVIKWFFTGMNYTGKFEEQQELYLSIV